MPDHHRAGALGLGRRGHGRRLPGGEPGRSDAGHHGRAPGHVAALVGARAGAPRRCRDVHRPDGAEHRAGGGSYDARVTAERARPHPRGAPAVGRPRLGRRRGRDGDGDLGRPGPAAAARADRGRAAPPRPDLRPLRGPAPAVVLVGGRDADDPAGLPAPGAPDLGDQRGRPAREAGLRRPLPPRRPTAASSWPRSPTPAGPSSRRRPAGSTPRSSRAPACRRPSSPTSPACSACCARVPATASTDRVSTGPADIPPRRRTAYDY